MAEDAGQSSTSGVGGARKTSVFVSYARKDSSEAAKALVAALIDCGFDAYLDQKDITAGEDWRKRLGDLVLAADTIVFLISPCSVTSEACLWEISEAERLSKRLIPAVWKPVPDDEIPAAWSRRNYVFLDNEATRHREFEKLTDAIRTDVQWVREHTRLGSLAERWEAKSRSSALLLRGHELEEAERWTATRPHNAPPPSPNLIEFLAAGRRAGTRRQRILMGGALAAVVLSIGAALLFAQKSSENARLAAAELTQRKTAEENAIKAESSADRAKEALKLANEQREKADENALRAVSTQSVALATLAQRQLENGDATAAALIALEALPGDAGGVKRPYEPEIEATLYKAAYQLNEQAVLAGNDAFFDGETDALVTIDDVSTFTIHSTSKTGSPIHVETSGTISRPRNQTSDVIVSVNNDELQFWRASDGHLIKACPFHSARDYERPDVLALYKDQLAILFTPDSSAYAMLSVSSCNVEEISWLSHSDDESFRWVDFEWNGPHAAFSHDGRHFIVSAEKGAVWDTASRKPVFLLPGYSWPMGSLFSKNDDMLFTRSTIRDGVAVTAWSLPDKKKVAQTQMHSSPILDMLLLGDGGTMISSGRDQSVKTWSYNSDALPRPLGGHTRNVEQLIANHDGSCFLTIDDHGGVRGWSKDLQSYFSYSAQTFGVRSGHISKDCSRIVLSDGRSVRVVSTRDGERGASFVISGILPEQQKVREPIEIGFDGSKAYISFDFENKSLLAWEIPSVPRLSKKTQLTRIILTYESQFGGICVDSPHHLDAETGVVTPLTVSMQLDRVIAEDIIEPKSISEPPDGDRLRCVANDGLYALEIARGTSPGSVRIITRAASGEEKGNCNWDGDTRGLWQFTLDGKKLVRKFAVIDIVDPATCQKIASFEGLHLTYGDGSGFAASMSEFGDYVATYEKDAVKIYRLYGSINELALAIKGELTRCLSLIDRKAARLEPEPPRWCITGPGNEKETSPSKWQGKWPYHTDAWKSWLIAAEAARAKGEAVPPLPADDASSKVAKPEATGENSIEKNASANEQPKLIAPPMPMVWPAAGPAAEGPDQTLAPAPALEDARTAASGQPGPEKPSPAIAAAPATENPAPETKPLPAAASQPQTPPMPAIPEQPSTANPAVSSPAPAAQPSPVPAQSPSTLSYGAPYSPEAKPAPVQSAAAPAQPKKPRKVKKVEDSIPAPFPLP